jgi:hypothetical protein
LAIAAGAANTNDIVIATVVEGAAFCLRCHDG